MKEKLTTTFLSVWALGILIIVMTAMSSCATSSGMSEYGNNNNGGGWGMEKRCGK
jgi:hypothetical protein